MHRPLLAVLATLALGACAESPNRPLPSYGVTGAFSGDAPWGLPGGGGAGPGASPFDQNRPSLTQDRPAPFRSGGVFRGNEPTY